MNRMKVCAQKMHKLTEGLMGGDCCRRPRVLAAIGHIKQ